MEDTEKQELTLALCGITDATSSDATLVAMHYLPMAKDYVLALRNPYADDPTACEWETRYDHLQCEIAAELYGRRGAEGEISHDENGVNRTWASAGVSRRLTQQVIPRGQVLSCGA